MVFTIMELVIGGHVNKNSTTKLMTEGGYYSYVLLVELLLI